MPRVFPDSNPLTADERVYIDSNPRTADEVVYIDSNHLTAEKRVFIDSNPLTAQRRVYVTDNPRLATMTPLAVAGGSAASSPRRYPEGLQWVVGRVWAGCAVLGTIIWAVSGGGGDPHAGRIPIALFGGGAIAFVVAWASRIRVGADASLLLSGAWIASIVITALAVAHRYDHGDFPPQHDQWGSGTVVACGWSVFITFVVTGVLVGLYQHAARR